MDKGGIYTYMTIIGKISISDDGNGNIDGIYLPNCNLPMREDRECEILAEAAGQINEFFLGRRRSFDLPTILKGTEFQMTVWNAISEIPYGETRTYSQIASAIGREKSQRAVGTACGLNPIPIIIPCHRVTACGGIGGYGGGSILKRRLLELESRLI